MVNTVLELAEVDRELNQFATHKLNAVEAAFARAFEQAQAEGELDVNFSAAQLANMVMTINMGLRVQSRKLQSKEDLEVLIENSLSLLGLAA